MGIPRRSGRYPWGSGNRPYQSEEKKKNINPGQVKQIIEQSGQIVRSSKNLNKQSINKARRKEIKNKDISKMTDQELREAVNRMNLEKSYNSLSTENIASGRQRVDEILDSVGDVLSIGASVATLLLLFKNKENSK